MGFITLLDIYISHRNAHVYGRATHSIEVCNNGILYNLNFKVGKIEKSITSIVIHSTMTNVNAIDTDSAFTCSGFPLEVVQKCQFC